MFIAVQTVDIMDSFQLVANAVCPHCSIAMTPLPIPYQDFMDLDYPQRQILISRHMINAASPLDSKAKQANKAKAPGRQSHPAGAKWDDAKSSDQNAAPDNTKLMTDHSAAPGKTKSSSTSSNLHPDISKDSDKETLYQEKLALRRKNEQLEQTQILWMHDLIWKLTRQLHILPTRKLYRKYIKNAA